MTQRPRLLIEEWLPAAAIGVECIRERSTGQQPPDKRLHIWWARRPLTASRAAVLASVLPADFPRDVFERLLGFGRPGRDLIEIRRLMDTGYQVPGGFNCDRAFKRGFREEDLALAHDAATALWGQGVTVLDPMAGGGSIPLESARLGFSTLANEYSPVACSVLEATTDYPFRFGEALAQKARTWSRIWVERAANRLTQFYPAYRGALVHAYIFARTVPCPDTQYYTPLIPDWHLAKPKNHTACTPKCMLAVPVVDKETGAWHCEFKQGGPGAGQLREPPPPTYDNGKGISLFTNQVIPADYIQAQAQLGNMHSALYAVAIKAPSGLRFQCPSDADLLALEEAEQELSRLRLDWEQAGVIPTERVPVGDKTGDGSGQGTDKPLKRGERHWTDMFSARQLLALGILVEELRNLRQEIIEAEGADFGEAVVHLLALGLDKFAAYNGMRSRWHAGSGIVAPAFDRHDYGFRATWAEMAPCNSGTGLEWAMDNVLEAYSSLAQLPRHTHCSPVGISLGSATNLPQLADGSVTAVVVDPPYAANVQYSELADFFYVWLKRTQGHRRPEWFSTYLCEHDEEAVVNTTRHKAPGMKTGDARRQAHEFYQKLMMETFTECRRVLRDDGVLTVMFTHKKQEAWQALFTSLIQAGFTITATWPVKTESEHSLHQAQKNAAQSTVILVARKREEGAGVGYFDSGFRQDIRNRARATAERLESEGLNRVDQLVGSFGPAMEVFSQYDEVRTDTGKDVGVERAIEEAADAVSEWRIEQLAAQGLEDVEAEGRFALLCWDVLAAATFRFNEAMLLGKAVGMDVDQLITAGLVTKKSDNIIMLSAKERRRERALEPDEMVETLFGPETLKKKRRKKDVLKVHPNDPSFRTALDGCHAIALRHLEAGGGAAGIGSAKALLRQQGWAGDSSVAHLMEALVHAAPSALWHDKGSKSAAAKFPEFRAWHELLEPLFGVEAPDWTEKRPDQTTLDLEPDDGGEPGQDKVEEDEQE